MLSVTDALTILDSIAAQAAAISTGFTNSATGTSNNRATILAEDDIAVAADLAAAFRFDLIAPLVQLYQPRRTSLDKHLSNINAFLTSNGKRVHRNLREMLGWSITTANTFVDIAYSGSTRLARMAVTGSGVGTKTLGPGVIDLTKYGIAFLQIKNTASGVVGAASIVVTVTGTKFDGSGQTKTATLSSGAAINAVAALGTLGTQADGFKTVTDVTFTGGTNGDQFDVEGVPERSISL